jgi:hypothetical protein
MPSLRPPLFVPQLASTALVRPLALDGFSPRSLNAIRGWFHPARRVSSDGAVSLAAASTQYLTVAHHADWSIGAGFTAAGWYNRATTGSTQYLAGKFVAAQREWSLNVTATGFLAARASSDGNGQTSFNSAIAAGAADAWSFVALRYDSTQTGAELSLSRNALTKQTAAHAGGVFAGTDSLRLGASDAALASSWDGRLDSWGFWNRALSDAEIDLLYNGGSGWTYSVVPGGLLAGMIAWYDLAEPSGTRWNRRQNNHHAAPTGTPSPYAGAILGPANDDDTVSQWLDDAGSLGAAVQSTPAARPTLENSGGGDSLISFDGADDVLEMSADYTSDAEFFLAWASNPGAGFGAILGNAAAGGIFVRHVSATQTLISDGTTTITFTHAAQAGLGVHVITGDAAGASHWFNGGAASSSSGGTVGSLTFNRIGMRGGGTPDYLQGDLGHVVLGNVRLPLAQVERLGRYLALRHQLVWTAAS